MKSVLNKIPIFIFSILFSMSILLYYSIGYDGSIPYKFINNFHFNLAFFLKSFVIGIIIFLITIFLFKLIDKIKLKKRKTTILTKKIFIISLICIFISGFICLLAFFPGSIMIDTLYILRDSVGTSSQHPLLYIVSVYLPFKVLSFLFNNPNISIFIMCICQLLIFSFLISYVITWFHKKFKNIFCTVLLISNFTILTIISNYNITLVKDSVFCIVVLLMIPIIYEIINSKGEYLKEKKNFVLTLLIFTITALIRNNGIFIVAGLLIIFLIKYHKFYKKILLICLFIFIFTTIQKSLSKEQLFQEKIAIPLQQISYVIYNDGSISKKDIKYLNRIYSQNNFKNNYYPYSIDPIKWDNEFNRDYLNKNKGEFIRVWINNLPNNFESYVKSYLLTTYGNWSLERFHQTQGSFLGISSERDNNKIKLLPKIKEQQVLPKIVRNFYEKTSVYLGSGICFWIMIYISLYIAYKRKYELLLLTVPLFIIWLSLMVATPLSLAFRYMSPYMYSLPLIMMITLIRTRKNA